MQKILLVVDNQDTAATHSTLALDQYQIRKIEKLSSVLNHVREFTPDVVVYDLNKITEDLFANLRSLHQQSPLPVAVFSPEIDNTAINILVESGVNFLVLGTLSQSNLDKTVQIACAQFSQTQALKAAMEQVSLQLEDRKKIDRAKAILIKTKNMSEDDAYHTMRKLAMERKVTIGELARSIIAMADLFK